jgi:peptidoglycan/xylan/chitin deacetylase (PgdA/CDA1 family)
MSLRRRVAGGLGALAYRAGLHRYLLRDHAVVAVFHRVDDRYPGDPITLTTSRFRAACDFFAKYFDVVPFGRLVTRLAEGKPLGGQLAITFDDGYRDNHAVAAPILKERSLPACFFITTDFVGSRTVPWWDRDHQVASEWMTWDEVRDLQREGFEIGAHTRTHPDLARLAGAGASEEIGGSKAILERELAAPVLYFAYPYGRQHQISEANRALVRSAGFACCASAFGGLVRMGDDPYALLRMPVTNWHRAPAHYGFDALRARRQTP